MSNPIVCPICGAQSMTFSPPHLSGPCPLAVEEHEARVKLLELQERILETQMVGSPFGQVPAARFES